MEWRRQNLVCYTGIHKHPGILCFDQAYPFYTQGHSECLYDGDLIKLLRVRVGVIFWPGCDKLDT